MPIGGTSYQPMQPGTPGGVPRPQITPQEAVRILSLRLPKSPQNLPVPTPLLTAQGGGGTGNLAAVLQALMRAAGGTGTREPISDAFVPPMDNGIGGTRSFTTPRITIGDQGQRLRQDDPTTVGPPPLDQSPLFDAGTPTIRPSLGRRAALTEPLF